MIRFFPRHVLLGLLMAMPILASATSQRRFAKPSPRLFARMYMDSLAHYRDSLYRDSVMAPQLLSDADVAAFFMPLTFYEDVARRAFGLDCDLTDADMQLLRIYLQRPDLVHNTQSSLEAVGPAIQPSTVTERPMAIVDKTGPQEVAPEPVQLVVLKPNFWNISGDYYLQFLQNYISSNWYKGGESNYSMLGSATFNFNYNNKQKVRWDNRLEMKLGMQTSKSDSIHKVKANDNLLRYTGKVGLQASKKWYYTFQLIAATQFTRIYPANSPDVQSDFMSPFTVNASVGMDYNASWLKGRLVGSVHLAPLAYNLKYVDRLALASRNGISEGHHSLADYGSQVTLDFSWKFSDMINWKSRLYWYTTYKRTEAEWENTISFQFNKYIASKFYFYPRFDDSRERDDDYGYWQLKEFFSVGFTYTI